LSSVAYHGGASKATPAVHRNLASRDPREWAAAAWWCSAAAGAAAGPHSTQHAKIACVSSKAERTPATVHDLQ